MSKEHITTAVLAERLQNFMDGYERKLDAIYEQTKATNGKVIVNTEFRLKTEGVLAVAKFVGFVNVIGMVVLAIKVFMQ